MTIYYSFYFPSLQFSEKKSLMPGEFKENEE